MAGNGLPWFRVYSEILDDKKIKRIVRSTEFSKAMVIGTWICLLALASESNERGRLTISEDMPYKLEDLADETGLEMVILQQLLKEFVKMGMIVTGGIDQAYEINNWNKRQFKSDGSSERVREHRAKQNETLHGCYSNGTDTDTDTELTTTTAPAQNVFTVYQNEIGVITSHIAEKLKADIDDFTESWVIDAIKVASAKQARNLPYVEAILKRWKTEGKDAGKRKTRAEPAGTTGNDAILEEVMNGKF